ncbi:TetR/AcrR family transcriptional regulator [Rummeliibacillus sp. TYF-LIM-RU47]|uniref:TetR/AcrR family transcriptional regulator n=1 Tax=unclassified Rummeliibacillus TaxID=2622809 RepID=UPI00123A2F49|nr:TetR/AcrR family transcriptional regulator [Rummeliibacillus sp. TYF-LIM-RU47]
MSTKINIMKAATELFAIKGYEGTTLKDIANAVGIKPPSIYAFFEGKEDVLLHIYQEILDEHHKHLQDMLEQLKNGYAKNKLYGMLVTAAEYHLSEAGKMKLFRRLMLFPPEVLQSEITESFQKLVAIERQAIDAVFEEAIQNKEVREGKSEDMTTAFQCLMNGLFLESQYYDEQEFYLRLDIIWEEYWMGISRKD